MARCKYCGAEVTIGERCTYCGSKAESWYYSGGEKKQAFTLNAEYDDLGAGRKIFRGKYYIVQKGDRANAELCLLGVRGKPKRMDAGVHSVIMSHIEEHSKKPAETRDRIVKLMAGGGYLK